MRGKKEGIVPNIAPSTATKGKQTVSDGLPLKYEIVFHVSGVIVVGGEFISFNNQRRAFDINCTFVRRGEREFLPAQAGSQKLCQWEVGSPEGRPRRNVVRRRPAEAAIRPARFVWIEAKHKKRAKRGGKLCDSHYRPFSQRRTKRQCMGLRNTGLRMT